MKNVPALLIETMLFGTNMEFKQFFDSFNLSYSRSQTYFHKSGGNNRSCPKRSGCFNRRHDDKPCHFSDTPRVGKAICGGALIMFIGFKTQLTLDLSIMNQVGIPIVWGPHLDLIQFLRTTPI